MSDKKNTMRKHRIKKICRSWNKCCNCDVTVLLCSSQAPRNFSGSPSLTLRLSLPFCLLRCHSVGEPSHAAAALDPFLLILLRSGPTDDDTFLPFSGSLWKRFLIFTAEKKPNNTPLVCVHRSAYPAIKTKGHFEKNISSTCHTERDRYAATPGCESLSSVVAGRAFLSFRLAPVPKYNHAGLFRLFSQAAWWRSSCLN